MCFAEKRKIITKSKWMKLKRRRSKKCAKKCFLCFLCWWLLLVLMLMLVEGLNVWNVVKAFITGVTCKMLMFKDDINVCWFYDGSFFGFFFLCCCCFMILFNLFLIFFFGFKTPWMILGMESVLLTHYKIN